jgi:hypothetical protein
MILCCKLKNGLIQNSFEIEINNVKTYAPQYLQTPFRNLPRYAYSYEMEVADNVGPNLRQPCYQNKIKNTPSFFTEM